MVLHWPAATDATSYRVIVDFFNAGVYVGSQDGGSFTGHERERHQHVRWR
jgi:hypothetical protein